MDEPHSLSAVRQQEILLRRCLQSVTFDRVQLLLQKLGFDSLLELQKQSESGGLINTIYVIRAKQRDNGHTAKLILRVSNPHPFWAGVKQAHEVRALQMVADWNAKHPADAIPIARALAFETSAESSVLGCEYLLTEYIEGDMLTTVIASLSSDQRAQIFKDILRYVVNIHRCVASPSPLIGCLSAPNGSIGPVVHDGPTLGPFSSFSKFILGNAQWACKQLATQSHLASFRAVIGRIERFLDLVAAIDKQEGHSDGFRFCHGDISPNNILVNVQQSRPVVTAILDWERSRFDVEDSDWNDLRCLIGELFPSEKEDGEHAAACRELLQSEFHQPSGYAERKILSNVLYFLLQLTFVLSSWFGDLDSPERSSRLAEEQGHLENAYEDLMKALDIALGNTA